MWRTDPCRASGHLGARAVLLATVPYTLCPHVLKVRPSPLCAVRSVGTEVAHLGEGIARCDSLGDRMWRLEDLKGRVASHT